MIRRTERKTDFNVLQNKWISDKFQQILSYSDLIHEIHYTWFSYMNLKDEAAYRCFILFIDEIYDIWFFLYEYKRLHYLSTLYTSYCSIFPLYENSQKNYSFIQLYKNTRKICSHNPSRKNPVSD